MRRILLCTLFLTAAVAVHAATNNPALLVRSIAISNIPYAPVDLRDSNSALSVYARFYDLPVNVGWSAGYIDSQKGRLFVQTFSPPTAKGTVLFTHGYLDHSAVASQFYRDLIDAGYAVAAWDMPGHGFSYGKTASVDNFSEYADALSNVAIWAVNHMPGPLFSVSHSTGCSAHLEFVRRGFNPFAASVYLAPLVQSDLWGLSLFGHFLFGGMVQDLPRLNRPTTSNPAFEERERKRDVLQPATAHMSWVNAMIRWNEDIHKATKTRIPVTIVQGTMDDVVDWRFNLRFLESFMDVRKTVMVEGARHHLQCEAEPYRLEVLSAVLNTLEGK